MWKTIKADQIPAKMTGTTRNSWKPDVDDVTAVFSFLINGDEAIMLKLNDVIAAQRKAEAMVKWIRTQTSIPMTITAFARGGNVIVTDISRIKEGM